MRIVFPLLVSLAILTMYAARRRRRSRFKRRRHAALALSRCRAAQATGVVLLEGSGQRFDSVIETMERRFNRLGIDVLSFDKRGAGASCDLRRQHAA